MPQSNRIRSLVIVALLTVGVLGVLSQSASGVAAVTHSYTWGSSNTWSSWSSWSHTDGGRPHTNSWSNTWSDTWTSHSWSHTWHSTRTTVTVVSTAYDGNGYGNGGYWNGGQYGGYNGGYYNGGYYNNGQYYPGYYPSPSPNQCYPYLYNGCYPSNPSQQYCPTPAYCSNPVAQTTQSASTQVTVSVSTEIVTVPPNSTDSNVQSTLSNQNYAQPNVDYSWLYVAIGLLAVGVVVFVVGFFAPRSRSQPNSTQPTYPQPNAAQSAGGLFCGRCGSPAPQGHVYCSKCGFRLG